MISYLSMISADWALFLLRIVIAVVFLAHGWPKIKDLKTTAKNFEMMGFKPGSFWGTIVAVVEFFGGICLLFGFLVQLAGILIAIDMLVATLWRIKNGHKLMGGFELELSLLAMALMLSLAGGGVYALDSIYPIILY